MRNPSSRKNPNQSVAALPPPSPPLRIIQLFHPPNSDTHADPSTSPPYRYYIYTERTFLAWLRTSLAFASIGIAVTQLFRLNTTIEERRGSKPVNPPGSYHLRQLGKPLGATFLGIAILVLLVGGRRYFESQVRLPLLFFFLKKESGRRSETEYPVQGQILFFPFSFLVISNKRIKMANSLVRTRWRRSTGSSAANSPRVGAVSSSSPSSLRRS